jgi:hypothetical protein
MKQFFCLFFVFVTISSFAQYNSATDINSFYKKDIPASADFKNILVYKNDSIFDKTLVFQNASKRFVNIENTLLDKITIYDALGKIQKAIVVLNNLENHVVDLSPFTKGIYFVVLESKNKMATRKIALR